MRLSDADRATLVKMGFVYGIEQVKDVSVITPGVTWSVFSHKHDAHHECNRLNRLYRRIAHDSHVVYLLDPSKDIDGSRRVIKDQSH